MITDRRKLITKIALYRMSSFHFYVRFVQNHFPRLYAAYKKGTYPNFRQRLMSHILRKPTNTPLCGLADRHRKADLNWKLKISNMADNAHITQSQVRDTRNHRMQKVNSLCTDSGPLQAEYCIVVFHTIQPSS